MRISVFGLGYVGCVSAACLARDGHEVIGVDSNRHKAAQLAKGHSPVVEPGLDALIEKAVRDQRLRVTSSAELAVGDSELSLICVGTPSRRNGSLNADQVKIVCRELAAAMARKRGYHTVVVRSTVLPGTTETTLIPLLEEGAKRRAGRDFGIVVNPEFMREGCAIKDYDQPGQIVIGSLDPKHPATAEEMYTQIEAPVVRTTLKSAEMLKYACNAFHALKVSFANEIGNLCKAHEIDGRALMAVFCQDQHLNISSRYLRPGFAFGGSCLPKDTRALIYRAKELDVELPVLKATLVSNRLQVERGIELVENTGRRKIGVLGLSFKAGTDDVRESPVVSLVETLLGRGFQVRVFDEQVELSKLVGKNKEYLEKQIPHISAIMNSSLAHVVTESEVVVITQGNDCFRGVPSTLRGDQILIDLVGLTGVGEAMKGRYEGICW